MEIMPELIDVKPKGIYLKVEYSLEEMDLLKKACEHCEIAVDLKDPEQKKIHEYFVNTFYPWIKNTVEMVRHEFGSNS
jgi:hypothetical protein